MNKIQELKELILKGHGVVFFGGAGVSTESNIPDYRSAGGIYSEQNLYPPEVILSHDFFYSHTEEFYSFYRRNMLHPNAKPNAAHIKLAQLEAASIVDCVITQNVYGLHQKAGSKRVYELHGTVYKNHCIKCNREYSLDYILNCDNVPRCQCGGVIKPDVVLYGESLDQDVLGAAISAISRARVLIIGGTSLAVYPAAGLINYAKNAKIVLINLGKTPMDDSADIYINDSIAKVMEQIHVPQ